MMVTGADVLSMLIPQGGWVIVGDEFENITWVDQSIKITKKAFQDGFSAYPAWKQNQDNVMSAQKESILNRLGITAEEAKLILS